VLSSQVGGAGRSSFQGGARAPTGGALEVLPEAGVGGSGLGDGRRRWSGRSGGSPSGAPMAASWSGGGSVVVLRAGGGVTGSAMEAVGEVRRKGGDAEPAHRRWAAGQDGGAARARPAVRNGGVQACRVACEL
jgi:hypothetical protein